MAQSQPGAFVSKSLVTRIRIFLAIGVIILAFIVYDIWQGEISWWLGVLAVLIGGAVGVVLGRLMNIKWHETEEQIISQMDLVGGIAIAAYILLEVSKDWIFGHFLTGAALGAFTLALLSGALFGRAYGMRVSILRLLRSRQLIG